MTTIYDVIKNLIRPGVPNTEVNQRQALLAVDAWEQGYPDAESWQEELNRRADGEDPRPRPETAEQREAREQAEQEQKQAAANAAANRGAGHTRK